MSEALLLEGPHKRGPKGPSKYTPEFIEAEAEALLKYCNESTIPFLKDFCGKRGYHSGRIAEFAKNEKFSEALLIYKDKIETQIVYGSITGKLNATFAIFTLKNIAGWRDKTEHELSGPDGTALPGAAPVNIKIINVEPTRSDTQEEAPRTTVVEASCQTSP